MKRWCGTASAMRPSPCSTQNRCEHNWLPARLARRFARAQDGAAAVEFALVAAPFLALIFAILETALVFFAGQTLEAAVCRSGAG